MLRGAMVFLFASLAGCGLTMDLGPPDPEGPVMDGGAPSGDAGNGTVDSDVSFPDAVVPDGGTVIAACNKPTILIDDFSDPIGDALWINVANPPVAVGQSGGQLRIQPPRFPTTGPGVVGAYFSSFAVDLRNDHAAVEVVDVLDTTNPQAVTGLSLSSGDRDDRVTELTITQLGGQLLMIQDLPGSPPTTTRAAYQPDVHRWWRIRESGGNVFWETSPDGRSWVDPPHRTEPSPAAVRAMRISLAAGVSGTRTVSNDAIFDNFNLDEPLRSPSPFCPADSFSDGFEDGVQAPEWQRGGEGCRADEQMGAVHFETVPGAFPDCVYTTTPGYDLRGRAVVAQVDPIAGLEPDIGFSFQLRDRNFRHAGVAYVSDGFWFGIDDAFAPAPPGEPPSHWKIREEAGYLVYEHSSDGVTWDEWGRARLRGFDPSAVSVGWSLASFDLFPATSVSTVSVDAYNE